MFNTTMALDIVQSEIRQSECLFYSAFDAKVKDLQDSHDVSYFVENSYTLVRREATLSFWKSVQEIIAYCMEKENQTVLQAFRFAYDEKLKQFFMDSRSINNCTCAFTNTVKAAKVKVNSENLESFASIIQYVEKEITK
jgi:hypothetical protein